MNRRHFITLSACALPITAYSSVVFYMVAVDPRDVPALDKNRGKLETLLLESSGPFNLYLDKAWDGLHWVLTGSAKYDRANLLSEMLRGGKQLTTQLPYGKPSFHSPEQVEKYSQQLRAETESSLRSRYAPAEMDMQNVYPGDWAEDAEEGLAYLLSAYRALQTFIDRSAKAKKAVLCSWS